jgi:hypothetical protein
MDTHLIEKFERIGARAKIEFLPSEWSNPWRGTPRLLHPNFSIDIQSDKHGQYFKLRIPEQNVPELEVLDIQRNMRHLLLLARQEGNKDKFLCGHDERHWFTCAVPGQSVSNVITAMNALRPAELRNAPLKSKERFARHTSAFIRQGEWFFIPEPRLIVADTLVLHREPISRGRGKPHWLENAYRTGGELVYVNNEYPLGLIESEYKALIANKPSAGGIKNWRTMHRNAAVYAKGAVSHPDHATIYLRGWHRVIMNTEHEARAAKNIVFLD